MVIVKATVERWADDSYPAEQQTLEFAYADTADNDTLDAEDEVRENLEEAGEHVLCVWAELI